MPTPESLTPIRILIINPNTSASMTAALEPVVSSLNLPASSATYTFFTCPAGPGGIASINSPSDAAKSAEVCLPHVLPQVPHHDAFLVACYSQHPLVGMLRRECAKLRREATKGGGGAGARKYVSGIFEASVLASLALLGDDDEEEGEEEGRENSRPSEEQAQGGSGRTTKTKTTTTASFGIVSTGKVWEEALQGAVEDFLAPSEQQQQQQQLQPSQPSRKRKRFTGCETTGLNASELHDLDPAQVREKMMAATKRLLLRGAASTSDSGSSTTSTTTVQAICLGCAGMVGLDDAVREACVAVLGEEKGKEVHIVDGVKAGVAMLYGLARVGM